MEKKEVYASIPTSAGAAQLYNPRKPVRKIKIFRSDNAQNLMDSVNSFIAERDIICIHYTTPATSTNYVTRIYDSVMVEYWELEE